VEAGIMPAKMVPEWEIPARDLYMEYPQRQRDEALRTGTFGEAAMIYAARSLGLGSTPMIGFDAEAVGRGAGASGKLGAEAHDRHFVLGQSELAVHCSDTAGMMTAYFHAPTSSTRAP
jgi:hypothetical protein